MSKPTHLRRSQNKKRLENGPLAVNVGRNSLPKIQNMTALTDIYCFRNKFRWNKKPLIFARSRRLTLAITIVVLFLCIVNYENLESIMKSVTPSVFRHLQISRALKETITNYSVYNWFVLNSNFLIYTVIIFRSRFMIFQSSKLCPNSIRRYQAFFDSQILLRLYMNLLFFILIKLTVF